jgi:hypothetical protein
MNSIKLLLALSLAALLAACASGSSPIGGDSQVTEATSKQLTGDMPLPPGATIKQQETLVMGAGSSWMGRLGLSVSGDPQAVFTYFRDNLPGSGWTLTSSSFAKLSLLTFTKADRVANVQIQNGSFGSNDVLITVAPMVRAGSARP